VVTIRNRQRACRINQTLDSRTQHQAHDREPRGLSQLKTGWNNLIGNYSVGPVPKLVLNTVRIPLSAFGGVNLHNIRAVEFTFNEQAQGAVLVTDIAFASAPQ
jgi:hypothetical protein